MKRWGELLAAVGIVISLIFVGFELRQNTVAVRAASRTELAAASREWLMGVAESTDLSEALRLWVTGDSLTPLQHGRMDLVVRALLRHLENTALQVEYGVVEPEALANYGFRTSMWQSPHFPEMWARLRPQHDPAFVEVFEAELERAGTQ